MFTADAQKLAVDLMNQHGLTGWKFAFDRSVRRFGACKYGRFGQAGTISLSAPLTVRNSVEHVKDVILHEIAHALAGHAAGHGPEWRNIARIIGAKPERCYSSAEVVQPKGKYTVTCKHCNKSFPVHKLTRKFKTLMIEQARVAQGLQAPGTSSVYHAACGRTNGRLFIEVTK